MREIYARKDKRRYKSETRFSLVPIQFAACELLYGPFACVSPNYSESPLVLVKLENGRKKLRIPDYFLFADSDYRVEKV